MLVSWLVLAEQASVNAALSARGKTVDLIACAIAEQLSLIPGHADALLAQLSADRRPVTIVIGELDESGPDCDGAASGEIMARLVNPLTGLPTVRLLVEGRPHAVGTLAAIATVVNLDDPQWTNRAVWADAAESAYPNAGRAVAMARTGPAEDVWRRWLDVQPSQARPALFALGFTYAPVDAATWQVIMAGLSGDAGEARASVAAAASLLGTEPYALPARPIAEAARGAYPEPVRTHRAIAQALHAMVPRTPQNTVDWGKASGYVRANLFRHARAAGIEGPLLSDLHFLVHAEMVTGADGWDPPLNLIRDPAERAAVARLSALRRGDVADAERFGPYAVSARWSVAWTDRRNAPDWPGGTFALALGAGPRRGQLLIGGGGGRLRAVRPEDGESVGEIPTEATGELSSLVGLGDGGLLALDEYGGLHALEGEAKHTQADRLSSLLSGAPAGAGGTATMAAAVRAVKGLATLGVDEDRTLLVGGDDDGRVHAWKLGVTPSVAPGLKLHSASVTAVACLRLSDEVVLLVSGGADGAVRLWSPGQEPMDEPVERRDAAVTAIAAGRIATRTVAAVAWADGLIQLWDLLDGVAVELRLDTPAYALVRVSDDIIALGGTAGTTLLRLDPARLWAGVGEAIATPE
jgi:hypothetical protein